MRCLALVLLWAACGASDDAGLFVDLTSSVTPLDRATMSVFGTQGVIVLDQELSDDGALDLPRQVRIDGGARSEPVRILVWGERSGARVAFGHASAMLRPGKQDEVAIKLAAPEADCDADGVPNSLDGCVAIADPAQADADGDGTTDACTPGAGCPANAIGNPGFEGSEMGWGASAAAPATLVRVAGGHLSGFAGEVCKVTSGTAEEYSMDDRPAWIGAPVTGTRYRADAWLRAVSGLNQRIDMRLGELTISGNNPVSGTQIASADAPAEWQLVTVTYAASGPVGTTEIDLRFRVLNAVDGSCFDVDDVCLQPLAPQCP